MASESLHGFDHDESLRNIDRLIEEIDAGLKRTQGTTGIIVTDVQDQRILRVLRIMRQEIAALIEEVRGDDIPMGGDAGEGPLIGNDGRVM